MIDVGRWKIASVVTGTIRLDGGAMFGVVPKVLWEKSQDVDGQNRILLAMRTLVARDEAAGRLVLVDSGAGSKWSEDEAARYDVHDDEGALERALGGWGLGVRDVTDVVITHAHFDHAGGLTLDEDGGRVRFANARHWVHERHWVHAVDPHPKDRASFLARDFAALEGAGVLEKVSGDEPPMDGMRWMVSDGHTEGQLLPVFEDDEAPLLFAGDMIPTTAHLPPLWVMAYDLQPMVTIRDKERVLGMCAEGLLLAFPHDRAVGGARVDPSGRRPRVADVLDLRATLA